MGNSIKYTTGTEANSLVKGNFRIGTGDADKGPTSSTGFYKATAPPEGGYKIYLYNENVSGNIAYHTAANDSELIAFTNSIAGQSFTSTTECFRYYNGDFNTYTLIYDKVCINNEIPDIPTDSIYTHIDFNQASCYPFYIYDGGNTFGPYMNDLGKNGAFAQSFLGGNDPLFTSTNGGGMVLDGVDGTLEFVEGTADDSGNGITVCMWISNLTLNGFRTPIFQPTFSFYGGFLRVASTSGALGMEFYMNSGPGMFWRNDARMVPNTSYPIFICLSFINRGEGNYGGYLIMNDGNSGLIGGNYSQGYSLGGSNVFPENVLFGSSTLGYTDQNFYMNGTFNMFSVYNKSFFPITTDVPADDTIPAEIQQYYDATKGRFGL